MLRGTPRGKRSTAAAGETRRGGLMPLWASVLSPEGGTRRSQGRLPKGRPLQKAAAQSAQVGTNCRSPPGAWSWGCRPGGRALAPASPPHTRPPTLTCPLAHPPLHSPLSTHVWPAMCWGLGPTRSVPLRMRGPARSRAPMGGWEETLSFRAARGWPASPGHLTEGPGPCSHPWGVFSLTRCHPTAAHARSVDPTS